MDWPAELKWMLRDSDPYADTFSTIELRWHEMAYEDLLAAQAALLILGKHSKCGLTNALRVVRDLDGIDAKFAVEMVKQAAMDCTDTGNQDMALQCFECWDDPSFIPFLESLELKEDWLREYRDTIVKWLRKCGEKHTEHCLSQNGEEKNMAENESKDVLVLDVLCDENGFAAVPFDLTGQEGAVVYVDWHDGEDGKPEELSAESSALGCTHRYAEPKTMHRIEVSSPDWSRVCICGVRYAYGDPVKMYPPMSFAGVMSRCRWSIKSPLPPLKGTAVLDLNGEPKESAFVWNPEIREGSMEYAMTLFKTIEELPGDLFGKNQASSFTGTFKDCAVNCAVPAGLFRGQGEAESFAFCFDGCQFGEPDAFPEWIFQDCVKARDFTRVFAASNLSAVPEGMFYGCSGAEVYTGAFAKTPISVLPSVRLFMHSPKAYKFNLCFFECTRLKSLPSGLFAGTSAKDFMMCFASCTAVDDVKDVFGACTEAENFASCFSGCSSIRYVPSNLFGMAKKATTFCLCFEGCSRLGSISNGFLDGLSEAVDFSGMFKGCSSVVRIPDRLFEGCVKAETFAGAFEDCRSLEIVPDGVFKECEGAKSFHRTFAKCSALHSVGVNVFAWCGNAEDFTECFDGCVSLVDASVRISSPNVKGVSSFFPRRSRVRPSEILSVYVPYPSRSFTEFRNAEMLGSGWSVESYSA